MQDIRTRFMAKVRVNPETGCHEWQGILINSGYGRLTVTGRKTLAHRLAYEMYVGPIPDGLVLDHLCRVRHCVNVTHLEPKTARANTFASGSLAPAKIHAAATTCPRGHDYRSPNLVQAAARRGQRGCLACSRASALVNRRAASGIELDLQEVSDRYYVEIMAAESEVAA